MKHLKGYSIAFAGLSEGVHLFEYPINAHFLAHFEGALMSDAQIQAQVKLEKRIGFLKLYLSIQGTVRVICDVCNEPFDLPLSGQDQLVVKIVEQIPATADEEIDIIYLDKGATTLHIAQPLYELLSLSLPMRIAHPDDEHGNPTCNPDMLQFLQPSDQQDLTDDSNEETPANSIWSSLKSLKDNK